MKFYQEYKNAFRILSKGRVVLDVFSKGIKTTALISTVAASALMGDVSTTALPTAPNIVQGNINIQTNTANMLINQSTNQGIINWGTFNIGSAASVRFNQPNASSSTLNRVVGNEVSNIAGSLSATGKVILINPNGVIFGNGSRVDVGGIVASTMNLSNENYLNNTLRFTRDGSTGTITNRGTIRAEDAGYVALLAPEVINEGVVIAQKGSAIFASGDAITLSADNAGLLSVTVDAATVNTLIENKALVQADGGVVYMSAKAASDAYSATISNTGTIQANSLEEKDGKIILFAYNGTMNVDGTIIAKGGFVETSGENVHIADTAKVTTLTDNGKAGTWLIDPTNFTISAGSGAQTTSGIGADTLQTNLAGGNIAIATDATANGSDLGDIIINAPLSWSANTLTLSAHRHVLVNNVVTVSGTGGLTVTTNTSGATGTSMGYLQTKRNGTTDFTGKINWSSSASPTINGETYTIINSQADLENISGSTKYALGSNLTLSGTWTPLTSTTPFSGKLDGFGHTISNLSITGGAQYSGLFAKADGITLQNIGLTNSTLIVGDNSGGFVGDISTSATANYFRNIFNSSSVSVQGDNSTNHKTKIGGFVGSGLYSNSTDGGGNPIYTGYIYAVDSANAATVSATNSNSYTLYGGIGGFFGNIGGYVYLSNLTNSGQVVSGHLSNSQSTASNTLGHTVGGIAGYINLSKVVSLNNLTNSGLISGTGNVGGIVGIAQASYSGGSASGTKLKNSGNIFSTGQSGGIAGGISSYTANIDLSYLSNTAQITSHASTGGLLGNATAWNGTITISNAYNSGAVAGVGYDKIGGLFGALSSNQGITLTYAYNSGSVTGNQYISGITATNDNGGTTTFQEVYNTGTISGQTDVSGIIALRKTDYGTSANYMFDKVFVRSGSVIKAGTSYADDALNYNTTSCVSHATISSGSTYGAKSSTQLQSITGLGFTSSKWYESGSAPITLQGFTIPITITLGALSKTYGDVNPTITYSDAYISGITWGSAITQYSNAGTYGYTTANMFTPTYASGSSSDYEITWATTNSFTINPKAVSLSGTMVYQGSTTSLGASLSVSNAVNGDVVTVTNGGSAGLSGKNVGTQTLSDFTSLSLSNANYTLTGASGSVSITARLITISTSNVTKTYDGTTTASGTLTSNALTQTTGLVPGDTLSGGTFAFTDKNAGAGNKTVTLSGVTISDGNSGNNYAIIYTNNTTSTINKATLSVTGSKVYDGTSAFTSGLTLGGFVGSETVGYSTATVNNYHVATANKYLSSITLTDGTNGGLASNYQIGGSYGAGTNAITITAKTLTPTISNTGVTKVYDGDTTTAMTPTYTFSGLVSGDTGAALNHTAKAYNDKDVPDANQITVSGLSIATITGSNSSAASDYVLDATSKTVAATITQKTVSLSSVNIADKVYDGTTAGTSVVSSTFTGGVSGDDVNVNGALEDFSAKDVGTYSISITGLALTGMQAGNYILSSTTATDNSVAITPKTVTLSASKVYNGTTNLSGAVTLGGFIGSETLNYTGATANSAHNVAGNYISAITLTDGTGGGVATNYALPTLNNANAPVTITPVTLTAALSNTAVTKVYDGGTATSITPTYTITGFIANDSAATIAHTAKSYNSKDVLTAESVTVSGLSLSGITGSNSSIAADYVLANNSLSTSATITAKSLTVSGLVADNKVYDGTTTATLSNWGSVSTGVGSETLALNHDTATFSDKNKANGKTVTATGYSLVDGSNGGVASNYTLSSTSGTTTADITARTVTLSGSTGVTKTYDALTTMPLGSDGYGTIGNGVTGDDLYVNGAPVFDSAGAGSKTVLVGSVVLAGTDANNYALNWSNGSGTINKAILTVTANNDAKFVTQNDTVNFAGVSYGGFVNGEGIGALTTTGLSVVRTNNSQQAAGAYSGVLQASGLSASNYQFDYVNGDYTIVPADQLLVRVANASSTYGTNAQYTITSAQYLDGSNQIISLSNPTITNNSTTFGYSDGSGGTAAFTLGALNASQSTAGKLNAGSYQLGATDVTETSANFSNNLVVVGNLAVSQKAVTVSASSVSKVYDGTVSLNNLSLGLSGVETGDTVTIGGNGSFSGKNAGINKAYSVSSLTLGSTDSGNYYLSGGNSMSGNDGEITKKAVTLSAAKTYDGTTDLTGKVTLDTGVTVNGLTETLTYSGATANSATVPNNSTNYIDAITLADGTNGGTVSNYQLPTLNHTNAPVTIAKKTLTVTPDDQEKIVGLEDPTFTYTAEGFVSGEDENVLNGALSREQGTTSGDYAITAGTLSADNYAVQLTPAKMTIKSTFIPPVPPTIPTPSVPGGGTGLGGGFNGGTGTGTGTGFDGGTGLGGGFGGSTGSGTGTGTSGNNGTSTGTGGGSSGGSSTDGSPIGSGNGGSTEGSTTGSNASEASKGQSDGLNNVAGEPKSTEKASFNGISVGTTQSGKEVKAIIIQGASTSPTPVTMLVSIRAGEGFRFSLPSATVKQVAQSMGSNASQSQITGVSLSDGRALPLWLSFDIDTMSFSSANVPAGGLPLTVKVIVANNGMAKIIEVVLKNDGGI